jgi:hypothetical protein
VSHASDREREAWEARFKHMKAGHTWAAIATEKPESREVSEILSKWMYAYGDADADAEKAFRELAAKEESK